MFTDDIHPEELLIATRALTEDERADLRAHAARCPACALQLALRADVAQAFTPTEADYEIAERALARVLAARAAPAPTVLRARTGGRARLAMRVTVVVAVMLGTGVAASALVVTTHGKLWGVPAPSAPPPPARAERARAAREVPAPAVLTPSAPVVPPAASALPVGGPRAGRLAAAPPREEPPPPAEAAPVEVAAEAPPVERASDLFAAAERARRDGEPARAERLYARLATAFPGTREDLLARVLRGQTLLDNLGHPQEALDAFDAYLRDQPSGSLDEEARAGRAQALWMLGRADEEAAAWRALLAAHPRSLHATLARSRLAALSKTGVPESGE